MGGIRARGRAYRLASRPIGVVLKFDEAEQLLMIRRTLNWGASD